MKILFSFISTILMLLLLGCGVVAGKSQKTIGKSVAILDFLLLLPITGSVLISNTHEEWLAMAGGYLYFIGIDLIILALMHFATEYCKSASTGHKVPHFIYVLLAIDIAQILFNLIFGHAFSMTKIMIDNSVHYMLCPHIGQIFHRIVDYSIFSAILLVFTVMVARMPRIYTERYSIILFTLMFSGIWQISCIFSHSPVDHSTIGFGIGGIIIFYFSLFYRPLKLLDHMLSDIISETPEALFVFDPNGKCVWVNAKGCQMANIKNEIFENAEQNLIPVFGESIKNHQDWREKKTIRHDTELLYYMIESRSFTDEQKRLTGSYLRILDITAEQQKIRTQIYEATHDILTGLYTREYLYQRITELFENRQEQKYLIIFVNIKNFKIVNDVFGREFGDTALQAVADWVRRDLSENCRYGRLGGDTFGICMPETEFIPEKIEKELSDFVIRKENAVYQLLIQLGVYHVKNSDMDITVMFDRAHLAISMIEDEYKIHIAYYNQDIREKLLWNQNISAQLYEAIAERQIRPYLQPIADRTGKIVGAEALARWIHPEHGFMSPASFIPVFEKNGMIAEVDRHIWRCACETLAEWKKAYPDLFISVNISPKDFYFMDVLTEIKTLVKEFSLSPAKLRVEITETVMMNDAENRMQILDDFRKAGFIVEMDDFGSGFSSLNLLKDMPVDVLKIDMKFLGKTEEKSKAQTIVRNIIHLSEELGISSLTEGVETEQQYHILSEMGCRLFQGYYFSKPLPVNEFENLL